jgi:hypothetical protein
MLAIQRQLGQNTGMFMKFLSEFCGVKREYQPNERTLIHNFETWLSPDCHRTEPVCVPFQTGFGPVSFSPSWRNERECGLIGFCLTIPTLKLILLKWLCGANAAIGHGRQLVFE